MTQHKSQSPMNALNPIGVERQEYYANTGEDFDPYEVIYANDFHKAWVEHREGIGLSLEDACKKMEEGTDFNYINAQKWIRHVERGRLFVPFLNKSPKMDYYPLVRLHSNQCKVTQEMLNEWAELLPEGIERKTITPVDIHNVL